MLYQEFCQGPEVARIQVLTDSQTKQQYIRLDDIQEVFPDAFRFCVDGNSVSFMIAADGTKYDNPRRVPHVPGRVLQVIARTGGSLSPSPVRTPSPLDSMQSGTSLSSIGTPPPAAYSPPSHRTSPGPSFITAPPSSSSTTAFYSSSASMTLTAAATALSTVQQDGSSMDDRQQQAQQMLYQARVYLEVVQSRLSSGNWQDLVQYQTTIHSDIARLERLVQDLQTSHARHHEAVMAGFMQMLQLQQQALDRLSLIQARVEQILVQSFELVEYPIPRLFIVLPDTKRRCWDPTRMLSNRFRLYFLCECGGAAELAVAAAAGHSRYGGSPSLSTPVVPSPPRSPPHSSTSPSSSPRRSPSNDPAFPPRSIHIAPHEGYEILRPTQFFEKYGQYILGLLHILKYGLSTASIAVPAINQLQVVDGVKQVANNIRSIAVDTLQGVDHSIEYLDHVLNRRRDNHPGGVGGDYRLGEIQPLEGADLRRLESFLRVRDPNRVLGNLYRLTTNTTTTASDPSYAQAGGHVQWVCLDHYRWPYKDQVIKQLLATVQANPPSSLDVHRRRASVTVRSSASLTELLAALSSCPVVYDLALVLDFNFSYADLSALKHALPNTNVQSLSIDGCEHKGSGPAAAAAAMDFLSWPPGKHRFDPLLRILATHPRLQRLRLANLAQFCKRTSSSSLEVSAFSPSASSTTSSSSSSSSSSLPNPGTVLATASWMRALHYSHEMGEADQRRLAAIVRACPRLQDLRLGNQFDSYVYPELWKTVASLRELEVLHLYGVTDMSEDVSSNSCSSSSTTEEEEENDDDDEDVSENGQSGSGTQYRDQDSQLSPVSSVSSSIPLSAVSGTRSQQSSRPGKRSGAKSRSPSKELVSFVDYFAQAYGNVNNNSSKGYRDAEGDVDMESISPTTAAALQPSRHRRLRELVLVRSGLAASDVLRWLRVLVGPPGPISTAGDPTATPHCHLEVLQVELVGMYPLDLQALFVDHCPHLPHRLTRLWLDIATVDERNLQSLRLALRSLPLLTHLGLVLEDGHVFMSDSEDSFPVTSTTTTTTTTDQTSNVTAPAPSSSPSSSSSFCSVEPKQADNHPPLPPSLAPKQPGLTSLILASIIDLPAISHLYLGRFDCRELAPFLLRATAHPHARLQSLTLDGPLCPREGHLADLLQQLTTPPSLRALLSGAWTSDHVHDQDHQQDEDDEALGATATIVPLSTLTHLALLNCFESDSWLANLLARLDLAPLQTLVLNYVALGPDATAVLQARAPEFLAPPLSGQASMSASTSTIPAQHGRPLERLMLYGIDDLSMDIAKFLQTVRQRALAASLAGPKSQQQQQPRASLTVQHGFISSHDMFEWMQWLD